MINKKDLDPETITYLTELLDKSPRLLNDDEKAFIRARQSYLSDKEVEAFKEILVSSTMSRDVFDALVNKKVSTKPATKLKK